MIFKKKPYYDSKMSEIVLIGKIIDGLRPTIPNNFENKRIALLLKQCWNSNFEERPRMIEIIQQLKQEIEKLSSPLSNFSTMNDFTEVFNKLNIK